MNDHIIGTSQYTTKVRQILCTEGERNVLEEASHDVVAIPPPSSFCLLSIISMSKDYVENFYDKIPHELCIYPS